MRELFGEFTLSRNSLAEIWTTGTIVPDTNVLLNIYEFTDSHRMEPPEMPGRFIPDSVIGVVDVLELAGDEIAFAGLATETDIRRRGVRYTWSVDAAGSTA